MNFLQKTFCALSLIILGNASHLKCQVVEYLQDATDLDSSYYDIIRLNSGEVWMGGEFGILKKIDEKGNLSTIKYPSNNSNILKLIEFRDYVFIAGDKGTIYRYDLKRDHWRMIQIPGFKNKCFYDICIGDSGSLLLCGGNSGIALGKKMLPKGFIVSLDTSLNLPPSIQWRNSRKFVWSLVKNKDGSVIASVFNGLSTCVYTQNKSDFSFKKGIKIKGLVHSLTNLNGTIYYSGSKSIFYKKDGIWGNLNDPTINLIKGSGFICNLLMVNEKVLGFSQQGKLYNLTKNNSNPLFTCNQGFAFYEAISDKNNSILLAGHGKGLIRIQLAPN